MTETNEGEGASPVPSNDDPEGSSVDPETSNGEVPWLEAEEYTGNDPDYDAACARVEVNFNSMRDHYSGEFSRIQENASAHSQIFLKSLITMNAAAIGAIPIYYQALHGFQIDTEAAFWAFTCFAISIAMALATCICVYYSDTQLCKVANISQAIMSTKLSLDEKHITKYQTDWDVAHKENDLWDQNKACQKAQWLQERIISLTKGFGFIAGVLFLFGIFYVCIAMQKVSDFEGYVWEIKKIEIEK